MRGPSETIDIEAKEDINITNVKRYVTTKDSNRTKNENKTKKIKLKPIKELSKHHHNIKEILQWSNTTPIHGRSDLGYLCCYCTEKFPIPADLKTHTLLLHKNDSNPKFLQKRDLKKYHVKVDITNLKCDICKTNIQNIEDLIDHLRKNHYKKIYTDIKNHIVGFKFEGSNSNELRCAVCSNVYTKFKILFEHMHRHSNNYICEECGSGFINNRALLNHQKRHNIGEFKCEHCEKVFDNLHKKNSHVTTVHVHGYLLNKCGYCNQKFAGYRTKAEHLRTAHGITERAICQACEKSFATKDSLNKHVKRHHLMDYRYSCTLCDMKFHANKSLEEHMVKHTKTRSFQCRVCFKRYGRQQTLKEHMRIHDNDRRFKCEHCVMAFVQKCSWRRHMQAKHDEHV
ncbi:zinc finger protein 26-like [Melitaea cinxia]|uniref:zinc finger protein 26-like n=1 Tax=Melitaea cinxia TaxID=113334 RepID=UPI001E26E9CB|nr:zinc finger protein 26-like [Melitaea cinxia]